MKIENGKIVEASESELFGLYLDRSMDDIMDFHEYRRRMENAGCVVKEKENCDMAAKTIEDAIRWYENELRFLKAAPALNSCPMMPEWEEQIAIHTMAIEALNAQRSGTSTPAAAEETKYGRWIGHFEDDSISPPGGCVCSECKTQGSPQWKRCPVCEAKMVVAGRS